MTAHEARKVVEEAKAKGWVGIRLHEAPNIRLGLRQRTPREKRIYKREYMRAVRSLNRIGPIDNRFCNPKLRMSKVKAFLVANNATIESDFISLAKHAKAIGLYSQRTFNKDIEFQFRKRLEECKNNPQNSV